MQLRGIWGRLAGLKTKSNVIVHFLTLWYVEIAQGGQIFLQTGNRGIAATWQIGIGKTGAMNETISSVLEEKHPPPPPFYIGGVQIFLFLFL